MSVVDFLEKFEADYTLEEGRPILAVRQVAVSRYFGGIDVARSVVVRADGKRYMCVLPAEYTIDQSSIRDSLGVSDIECVDDAEMHRIFPSCQSGAEPPFGALYGLPTLMDASLEEDQYIAFQGETYDRAIIMTLAEYKRLASPRVLSFARPVAVAAQSDWR